MYICIPCVCLVPIDIRKGHGISWSWRYRRLWTTMIAHAGNRSQLLSKNSKMLLLSHPSSLWEIVLIKLANSSSRIILIIYYFYLLFNLNCNPSGEKRYVQGFQGLVLGDPIVQWKANYAINLDGKYLSISIRRRTEDNRLGRNMKI